MIEIECYKGLPMEYESFLIEKYESYLTTCRFMEVHYTHCEFYYLLVYDAGNLNDLLIFGNKGNNFVCFNSLVSIDQRIINECVRKIFENYPFVRKIQIDASYQEYFIKKSILYYKCNDHIIDLPSTMDEYYSQLGYHTRKNSKNRKKRLLRDYPNVKFITKYSADIEADLINKIIQLNCDRMKHKGVNPSKNIKDVNEIYQYSRHYGCVAYIEIDGAIVAGFISFILNKRIFGHVIAHDNNFSKYDVGEICMFYLIQTAIERGLLKFHFSWGEQDYKQRILAQFHSTYFYFIYRRYSLDCFFCKFKFAFCRLMYNLTLTKYSKPLRKAVRCYRKMKWKL